MSDEPAPWRPYYDNVIDSAEKAMAAAQLVGLDEELRSLRAYINEYMRDHKDEFDKVVKGMRLIMQMVVAQHRIGATALAETYAALEEATRELREAFLPPDIEEI
jgi:hypothetical protein